MAHPATLNTARRPVRNNSPFSQPAPAPAQAAAPSIRHSPHRATRTPVGRSPHTPVRRSPYTPVRGSPYTPQGRVGLPPLNLPPSSVLTHPASEVGFDVAGNAQHMYAQRGYRIPLAHGQVRQQPPCVNAHAHAQGLAHAHAVHGHVNALARNGQGHAYGLMPVQQRPGTPKSPSIEHAPPPDDDYFDDDDEFLDDMDIAGRVCCEEAYERAERQQKFNALISDAGKGYALTRGELNLLRELQRQREETMRVARKLKDQHRRMQEGNVPAAKAGFVEVVKMLFSKKHRGGLRKAAAQVMKDVEVEERVARLSEDNPRRRNSRHSSRRRHSFW